MSADARRKKRRPSAHSPAAVPGGPNLPAGASVARGPGRLQLALLARAVHALQSMLAFTAPADVVLHRFFQAHPEIGRRDRGFIAEATFACLRRLRWYRHLASADDARRLLLLAAQDLPPAERRDLDGLVREDERTWLAQARASSDQGLALGIRAELPDWAIDALRRRHDDVEILAIGHGMQESAPLDLRVNVLKAKRDEVVSQLQVAGLAAAPTPYSPLGIRVQGRPALEQHPLYRDGTVEVQDEGSQLLGLLLAPRRREMVADFCAGAGGKTLLLGALMRSEGRLYAFDVSAPRIRRLHARLARSGLSNVQPEAIAHENDTRLKRLARKLDRVLVDAPCTGLGTLRRNPDLKWRQSPHDLEALRAKQRAILESASRLVKAGGKLMYATCSILPEENDAIVDDFLASHPEFEQRDAREELARQDIALDTGPRLRLWPHRHATDGFFAALLERSASR